MDKELVEQIMQALSIIEARVSATELAQQVFATHLKETNPVVAESIATIFSNISGTDKLEISAEVRKHLSDLSLLIQGDGSVQFKGMLKPEVVCEPNNPIPWLQGVINGGKNT